MSVKYKRLFALLVAGQLSFLVQAQTVVGPTIVSKNSSFAIVADEQTFKNCNTELVNYQKVLESEGLPAYIIYGNWKNPEAVKAELLKLYKTAKLEGIVLIGDIPIPMIRKAQHLATAFKMDEKYDIRDSSIPSDRFYDTFELKFDFIKQDEKQPLFFYYNLAKDGANQINSQLYSGRIKPVNSGEDKYAQINKYLKKAIAEHQSANRMDHVVSYLGDGTLSNSLTAWTPDTYRLEEQFPGVFRNRNQSKYFRFDTNDYPKTEVINELRRDELDLILFHEHGMPERQYLSGNVITHRADDHVNSMQVYLKKQAAKEVKKGKKVSEFLSAWIDKYAIDSNWISGYDSKEFMLQDSINEARKGISLTDIKDIGPNARVVILDACYNADFREDDYVAGRYIFSDGKTVVALSNTVSILQDVASTHMVGLLGFGVRIGQWAKYNHVLESHIVGDPTLRFTPNVNVAQLESLIAGKLSHSELLKLTQNDQYADVQSLALTNLYLKNYVGISKLLNEKFHSSPYATVRLTCMSLLKKMSNAAYHEVLKSAINDADEFNRRFAINEMGKVGKPVFVPLLVQSYVDNQHAKRILFNLNMGLFAFDYKLVKAAADSIFAKSHFLDKEKAKAQFLTSASTGFYSNINKETFDRSAKISSRKMYINSLKNLNYHPSVAAYNKLVLDKQEPEELRVAMLQSLAWFMHSYRKQEIVATCKKIIANSTESELMKTEAERTLNILL